MDKFTCKSCYRKFFTEEPIKPFCCPFCQSKDIFNKNYCNHPRNSIRQYNDYEAECLDCGKILDGTY